VSASVAVTLLCSIARLQPGPVAQAVATVRSRENPDPAVSVIAFSSPKNPIIISSAFRLVVLVALGAVFEPPVHFDPVFENPAALSEGLNAPPGSSAPLNAMISVEEPVGVPLKVIVVVTAESAAVV
jgi:hypothetical protein